MDDGGESRFGGIAVLQGTFDTLALSELLGLIAQSRKTGALWLDAGPASAVLYVVDGRCCAAISSETPDAIEHGPALLVRLVDVLFAATRVDDGSFRLGAEEPPWSCAETVDLELANDELERLLEEWRGIQAVIPSLECRARLTEELGVEELVVDRERWRLLAAIDGRSSVRELARKTNRPVLEVCHAVVALHEAHACQIVQPAEPSLVPRSTGGKAARAVPLPRSRTVPA